ncbi:hypothetical protein FRB95_000355 [Tulasnella sp. JGI-2019a]|nr:hypothetical protein FRB95_000355 [Tulasnella sp. JGI-2019a]
MRSTELGASWVEQHEANAAYSRVKEEVMALIARLRKELSASKAEADTHCTAVSEWQRKEEHLKCVCLEAVTQLKAWMDKAGRLAKHVAAKDMEVEFMKAIEKGHHRKIKALKAQVAQVTATSTRPLTSLDWLQERADTHCTLNPIIITSPIGNNNAPPGLSPRQTQVPVHLPPQPLDLATNAETPINLSTMEPPPHFEARADDSGGLSHRKGAKVSNRSTGVSESTGVTKQAQGSKARGEIGTKRGGKKRQDVDPNPNVALTLQIPGREAALNNGELEEGEIGPDGLSFEYELGAEVGEAGSSAHRKQQTTPPLVARSYETPTQLPDIVDVPNTKAGDTMVQPGSVDEVDEHDGSEHMALAAIFDIKDEKQGIVQSPSKKKSYSL